MSNYILPGVKPLNSIEDTQQFLGGVCRSTTYNLIRAKKLHLVKVGRRSMITGDSIAAIVRGGA